MRDEENATAAALVDAINGVFGKQVRNRAIHAKGIVLTGRFTPARAAAELSKAPHLQGAPSEVIVRFSNFSGNPATSDVDTMAGPRGMAVRFRLDERAYTDLVMHSFNGFPAATVEEFRQLLVALGSGGAEAFVREHARARAFLEAPKPPPVSWATLRYFGVNGVQFTNAAGRARFGRYRVEPVDGEQLLSGEATAHAGADYLREEIRARVARGPARFVVRVQLAGAGDRIEDPSVAWPDSRETVELGALAIDKVVGHGDDVEGSLVFAPALLPDGIAPADPMIRVRDAAYVASFTRRHGKS